MSRTQVRDVMTSQVVAVAENTPYKAIVRAMRRYHHNALPVVDSAGRVLGMVSATDLLAKQAGGTAHHPLELPRPVGQVLPHHADRAKAAAAVAADLMTAPARTVRRSETVTEAARTMHRHRVNQLPVVDSPSGELLGIVTRSDLLRVYERDDTDILREILDNLAPPRAISVDVRAGVVILSGAGGQRGQAKKLAAAILDLEGVVHVVNRCADRATV